MKMMIYGFIVKAFFNSKGYDVENPTFYVLDLVGLTSLTILYIHSKKNSI